MNNEILYESCVYKNGVHEPKSHAGPCDRPTMSSRRLDCPSLVRAPNIHRLINRRKLFFLLYHISVNPFFCVNKSYCGHYGIVKAELHCVKVRLIFESFP